MLLSVQVSRTPAGMLKASCGAASVREACTGPVIRRVCSERQRHPYFTDLLQRGEWLLSPLVGITSHSANERLLRGP